MLNFFDWIVSFFGFIWDFIVSSVTNLLNLITFLGFMVTVPSQIMTYVPEIIALSLSLVVLIGLSL